MGKKIDLNARSNNQLINKNKHSFYHYSNTYEDNTNTTNEESNQVTQQYLYQKREYDLPTSIDMTIKMPIAIKTSMTIFIIGIIFIFLMIYIVLFGKQSRSSGMYTLGQTCTTVTITDTKNYIYDGEVSFNEYIEGVVAAESNNSTDIEYLKLLSIIARTYFFENADSSCIVEGNSTFQNYKDIENHINRDLIKKANNETKNLVVVYQEDLVNTEYCPGCIVDLDNKYYYLRYDDNKIQKISKEWAKEVGVSQELENLYSQIDKTTATVERNCPKNNSEYALSKVGALYLIKEENYNFEQAIKYYFGNDIEIIKNVFINAGNGDYINPTTNINCSSPYGSRVDPYTKEEDFHSGIDITNDGGEPVFAAKDGRITRVVNTVIEINSQNSTPANGNGYGNNVIIDHGDGTTTLYAHMKYGSIPEWVEVGVEVKQGDQIGEIGSTGRSTGNHLHYEVRVGGSTVDPADYLDLTDAAGVCQR